MSGLGTRRARARCRLASSVAIVDEQGIGRKLLSQRNGRVLVGKFRNDGGRDEDAPIEQRQDVGVLDQDEISKGARVGDDNHAAGRLARRIREVREALLA